VSCSLRRPFCPTTSKFDFLEGETDNNLIAHGAACIYGSFLIQQCPQVLTVRCFCINQTFLFGVPSLILTTLPACSDASGPEFDKLAEDVARDHPNTKIVGYPYRFATEEDTLALIDDVLNSWGRLDVWVTSSGLLGPPSIDDTSPTDLRQCFEANAMAPFFALKYAPPAMAKTTPKGNYPNAAPKDVKYGSIIVVSSVASSYGGCWGPCFTMTNHAALGVVRSGVATLKGTGIRINCISPGQINIGVNLSGFDMRGMSSQLPPASLQDVKMQKENIGLERAGLPSEIGKVAGFLASGFSSYVTGANIVVDGGAT